MKKIILYTIISCLLASFFTPVLATTSTTSTVPDLIQSLRQQIEDLKAKITTLNTQLEALRQTQSEVKEATKEVKTTLRLLKQLRVGMTGEDVKLLQEILATDPEIYPEGLVTGYFGKLTERAVKKFQQKTCLEQVGAIGPKTLSKINELLEEGAGSSGKVPPGLLIAPGIRKKLCFTPQPLPGQELPPGIAKKIEPSTTTPDTTAPVISAVNATSTTATSTNITWLTDEKSNSKAWYNTVTPLIVGTSTPMVSSSALVKEHDLMISGLTASTTYYYLVASSDVSGNNATSTESSFTTRSQ